MPWLPRVCGGFREGGAWRLYCLDCAQEREVTISPLLRRGDTHTEESCDACGRVLAETVEEGTVKV